MHLWSIAIVFLFSSTISGFSQTTGNLLVSLEQMQSLIGTVETEKTTYKQRLVYEEDKPWQATVRIEKVNNKNGKSNVESYSFNLNDLDPQQFKMDSKGGDISLKVQAKNNLKYLRHTKNGVLQNYVSHFQIYASSFSTTQQMEDAFEETLLPAEELWKASVELPKDAFELKEWLLSNVRDVDWDSDGLGQRLKPEPEAEDRLILEIEDQKGKKKLDRIVHEFSLADLEEGDIELNVKNKRLFVKAGLKKGQKFVETTGKNDQKIYDAAIEIHVASVDDGRMLVEALKTLPPFGEKELQRRMPKPESFEMGLNLLAETLASFSANGEKIEQSLSAEAMSRYRITRSSIEKPKEEVNSSLFYFNDLNANAVEIKDGNKGIGLQVTTKAKDKYIQNTADGLADNYSSTIRFEAESVENARLLQHLFQYVITESPDLEFEAQSMAWLLQTVKEASVEGFDQTLEETDTTCQLILKTVRSTAKKQTDSEYKFRLADLDMSKLTINIDGKTLGLRCATQRRKKIITYDKTGAEKTTEQVLLVFSSIEEVRKAQATLKELITNCAN